MDWMDAIFSGLGEYRASSANNGVVGGGGLCSFHGQLIRRRPPAKPPQLLNPVWVQEQGVKPSRFFRFLQTTFRKRQIPGSRFHLLGFGP